LRSRNVALWAVLAGTIVGAVLSIESLRELFGFAALHPDDLLLALALGILTLLWMDVWKLVAYRRLPSIHHAQPS
jgi:hypothetical protein